MLLTINYSSHAVPQIPSWPGSTFKWGHQWAPQLDRVADYVQGQQLGSLQCSLGRLGCRLCSLTGQYHWLDSAVGQGCGRHFKVAPGLVGPQTVIPDQKVLPAMLCIQVGPEAVS